jgi:DNA-binding IclR family transcriptional regulator
MVETSQGGSQTVDRALEVLRQVVLSKDSLLLDDLAARVDLNRSVTYRLVRSLENAGFISRDPRQGGYTIGAAFLSMSVLTASRINIGRAVRPAMEAIVGEFGETVSFHVRNGDQRVCVDVVEGTHDIRRVISVGETLPLYAGETGRVLLSELPDNEMLGYLRDAADAGLDAQTLREEVERIRNQHYLIGVGLRTSGVGSISVPIQGPAGLLGAMTISGPDYRWNQAAMEAALPTILNILAPTQNLLTASQ